MTAAPRKDAVAMEAEVREKIHLEILKRTGAYHANDHILLPSGQHTTEYIEKTLVTTEPSFTEGLGAVIAKHFAPWPIDVVLSTGPGALILSHCVARAHPSRPTLMYGTKGVSAGKRRVTLPAEFHRLIRPTTKVVIVEDLVSSGTTVKLLSETLDPAWGTLMTDLRARRLLDSTLIVWMGEFGRTPKINPQKGRDHFPNAWSTVLAGGSIKGGRVVGKTSPDGNTVVERPVSAPDFLATICLALGIDYLKQNDSNVGRPIRIAEKSAKPIQEIVA